MARRNLVRSLLAASLMVVPFAAGLMAAPAPAVGADATLYEVRLSEKSGFTPGVLDDVRVGDWIAFVLDMENSVSEAHSVTFDDPSMCPGAPGAGLCWPELRFNDNTQSCKVRNYTLPYTRCIQVRSSESVRYHDRLGEDAGGPEFQGLISMAGSSPPTTPTTSQPTTTTTAAPTTTTTRPVTTTTAPPTTATTAPTTIRPFLIVEPPTTTTTAKSGANAAGSGKNGTGSSPTTGAKDKDKGKNKGDSATASTTDTTVAPDAMQFEVFFDPAYLTPGPVTLPDTVETADGTDADDLDAAAVMNLLDPEESDDGETRIVLLAGAALGLLVLGGGLITWHHRSSRYFPA